MFAIAVALAASGCGAARFEQIEVELNRQREELSELRRNQAAQRVQFDEFRNRLVVLQDKLESERLAAQRAERGAAAEQMPSLPRVVVPAEPGEARPLAPRVPVAPPRSVVIGPDGVARDVVADGGPAAKRPEPRAATPAGPRPPAYDVPPQEGNTAEEAAAGAYRNAKSALDAGSLDDARQQFEVFRGAHPDHPLADNALYWIGETHYAKALWLKAARVFGEVVERYPRGNKVPDAMLKTAMCYRNLGERQLARDVLAQLARLYPGTPAAELGRELGARLEGEP